MQVIAFDHCGLTGSLNSISNHLLWALRALSSCTSYTHQGFGGLRALHEIGMLKILTHKNKNLDVIW